MEFEWDLTKNRANIAKHGVSFEDAARIFEGPVLTYPDDRLEYGEQRWVSIGVVGAVTYLTALNTDRDGTERIISARRATKREREQYTHHVED
jgi:uncharacterized DUF497 family protein